MNCYFAEITALILSVIISNTSVTLAFLKWHKKLQSNEKQEFSWVWRKSTCTVDAECSIIMDIEKTKAISDYHEATFSDWELWWIFGKDYNKQAVMIFTRKYAWSKMSKAFN